MARQCPGRFSGTRLVATPPLLVALIAISRNAVAASSVAEVVRLRISLFRSEFSRIRLQGRDQGLLALFLHLAMQRQHQLPPSATIAVFAQVDPLPDAQRQPPVLHRNRQ